MSSRYSVEETESAVNAIVEVSKSIPYINSQQSTSSEEDALQKEVSQATVSESDQQKTVSDIPDFTTLLEVDDEMDNVGLEFTNPYDEPYVPQPMTSEQRKNSPNYIINKEELKTIIHRQQEITHTVSNLIQEGLAEKNRKLNKKLAKKEKKEYNIPSVVSHISTSSDEEDTGKPPLTPRTSPVASPKPIEIQPKKQTVQPSQVEEPKQVKQKPKKQSTEKQVDEPAVQPKQVKQKPKKQSIEKQVDEPAVQPSQVEQDQQPIKTPKRKSTTTPPQTPKKIHLEGAPLYNNNTLSIDSIFAIPSFMSKSNFVLNTDNITQATKMYSTYNKQLVSVVEKTVKKIKWASFDEFMQTMSTSNLFGGIDITHNFNIDFMETVQRNVISLYIEYKETGKFQLANLLKDCQVDSEVSENLIVISDVLETMFANDNDNNVIVIRFVFLAMYLKYFHLICCIQKFVLDGATYFCESRNLENNVAFTPYEEIKMYVSKCTENKEFVYNLLGLNM